MLLEMHKVMFPTELVCKKAMCIQTFNDSVRP